MNLKKPYMCKEEEGENVHPAIQMQDPGLGGQLQRPAQHFLAHVGIICRSHSRGEPLPYRDRNYPRSLRLHQPQPPGQQSCCFLS